MKPKHYLSCVPLILITLHGTASAQNIIDVNREFDHNADWVGTAANWTELPWDPAPAEGYPNSVGVTAGINSPSGTAILTVDEAITLKQLQFYFAEATTLAGGPITWDSGEAGVSCELGRNRGPMTNFLAGRIFTVTSDFDLQSDLRMSNWVEGTRATNLNNVTSGPGKLTVRVVHWANGNNAQMNIGGSGPNTHEGGTVLEIRTAGKRMDGRINKPGAFGSGVLTLQGDGNVDINLNNHPQTVAGLVSGGTGNHLMRSTSTSPVSFTMQLEDGATTEFAARIEGPELGLVVEAPEDAVGSGVQILSGSNTYGGPTMVDGVTLRVIGRSAMQSTSGLSIMENSHFDYRVAADEQLAIAGELQIFGPARLGVAVGADSDSAAIVATGEAFALGNVVLDLGSAPGGLPLPGVHTLIRGGEGSSLAGGAYSLGLVWNPSNFTVGAVTAGAEEVTAELVAAAPLATAWWKGGFADYENVWAVSNGSTASNWSTDAGGTGSTSLVPGAGTRVVIGAAGAGNLSPMVLGASMEVAQVEVNTPQPVTLAADGSELTISPSNAQDGLAVAAGAGAVTVELPLVAGFAQTWRNDSTSPLTVTGQVSGSQPVVKRGSGTLVIGGAQPNLNNGGFRLEEGLLHLHKPTALGAVGVDFEVAGGALGNASGAPVTLANRPVLLEAGLVFHGPDNLHLGSGSLSLGPAASHELRVTAGNLTIGGAVNETEDETAIVKTGPGRLTLLGNAGHGGVTSVGEGTLAFGGAAVLPFSSELVVGSGATLDVTGIAGAVPFGLGVGQVLTGTGTVVGDFDARWGSAVEPGGAQIGTLTVNGSLLMEGELRLQLNGAANPKNDRLVVNGTLEVDPFAKLVIEDSGEPLTDAVYVLATYDALVGEFFDDLFEPMEIPGGYRLEQDYQGNKIALVSETLVPVDPYDDWIGGFGLTPAQRQPGADPDGDGIPNVLEFALNGNPTQAGSRGLQALVLQDTNASGASELTLVAAVRRGAVFGAGAGGTQTTTIDGIRYTVAGSDDLAGFTTAVDHVGKADAAPAASGLPSLAGSDWEYHTFRLAGSDGLAGKGFLRIEVEPQ